MLENGFVQDSILAVWWEGTQTGQFALVRITVWVQWLVVVALDQDGKEGD
jgi:hypothetical protein